MCSHNNYTFAVNFSGPLARIVAWNGGVAHDLQARMRQFISRILKRPVGSDLGHLTRLVRRYTVEQQQVPKDLVDLVSLNYLSALPVAPSGQRYVIDRTKVEVRLE
jgi:hypothetical protein